MMAGVGVKNLEGAVTNLEGGRVNEMAGDDPEGTVLKQVKLGEASACVVRPDWFQNQHEHPGTGHGS
jgi:hypothetical protein